MPHRAEHDPLTRRTMARMTAYLALILALGFILFHSLDEARTNESLTAGLFGSQD